MQLVVSFTSAKEAEMRKRQQPINDGNPQAPGNQRQDTCFFWSCCCSCSWSEETGGAERQTSTKMESMEASEECLQPTLEEVQSWTHNFDKMMSNPDGRNIFREFLRSEYSEENLLFWLACEDLKNEKNMNVIEEKSRTIYEDYISVLSPREVSLDSQVREVVNRNLTEPNSNMYDEAQLQVYTLMHRDSFPRFLNSPVYKSLLQRRTSSTSET